MKNCINIENNLPLYAEGLLSDAEKKAVEEHLAECADCSKALADLKKVNAVTQGLLEVEPPPWFKQKIMVRVRQQAEKKSFAQKWFYPLRIKVPVQVMATIVIAVLAVYIYRYDYEQMKAIVPEAPQSFMEAQQEPAPAEISKAKKAEPALLAKEKSAVIRVAKKDQMSEVSSGGTLPIMEKQGNKIAVAIDKSAAMKGDIAAEKEEKKYTEVPVLQEAQQGYAARQERLKDRSENDYSLPDTAKKRKLFKTVAPATPRQMTASVSDQVQPDIFIYVTDINSAVVKSEKILTQHNAKKVTKRFIDGKSILQAELPAKNLKNLLSQLRVIGRVEDNIMPTESSGHDIIVVIEIISN